MPVECQVSTVFPRPQTYWWHDRPVEVETLGERKSLRAYRSLLSPFPNTHLKTNIWFAGSDPARNTAFPANAHIAGRVLVLRQIANALIEDDR
jgi:hypothetical protein